MFTTPCFIRKNTPELRKKLEELGYFYTYYHNGNGIYCYGNIAQTFTYNNEIPKECIGVPQDNEDLFLSLAALRDDTDKWQLFVFDGIDVPDYFLQKGDMWICSLDKHLVENCHKATVEELISYFN